MKNWLLALIVTCLMLVTLAFAACANDNTDTTGGAQEDLCKCWIGQTIGGLAIESCTVRTDDQGRKDCDCQFGGGAQTTQTVCQ